MTIFAGHDFPDDGKLENKICRFSAADLVRLFPNWTASYDNDQLVLNRVHKNHPSVEYLIYTGIRAGEITKASGKDSIRTVLKVNDVFLKIDTWTTRTYPAKFDDDYLGAVRHVAMKVFSAVSRLEDKIGDCPDCLGPTVQLTTKKGPNKGLDYILCKGSCSKEFKKFADGKPSLKPRERTKQSSIPPILNKVDQILDGIGQPDEGPVVPDKHGYVKKWNVSSMSGSGEKYSVSLHKSGEWRCSCPHWTQRLKPRGLGEDCKHIGHIRQRINVTEEHEEIDEIMRNLKKWAEEVKIEVDEATSKSKEPPLQLTASAWT